jgi:DtxR family Mn-dependent transcriptional regulator
MLSNTEENYLKALLRIVFDSENNEAGTNELAHHLDVKPASASDMLKKLKEKQLIDYEKYGKITLTKVGKDIAIQILRKHRLWETFLYEKLEFSWDEVHEVAEQLEHIQSSKLIERLDKFLGFPKFDPHGDPIPNSLGELPKTESLLLSEMEIGKTCKVNGVKDTSSAFLQYLLQLSISIGTPIKVLDKIAYDGSCLILIGRNTKTTVSAKFAESLLVN